MNILGVQVVLISFCIFMFYVIFIHYKKRNLSLVSFIVWSVVWLMVLFFTMFPNTLQPLIKELFIVRVMDLGMISAFMLLFYLSIENNIKIKKYERQLEDLVRKIAISGKK